MAYFPWGGGIWTAVWLGEGGIWTLIFQKFKCSGGCPGGMLKLRFDWHITCGLGTSTPTNKLHVLLLSIIIMVTADWLQKYRNRQSGSKSANQSTGNDLLTPLNKTIFSGRVKWVFPNFCSNFLAAHPTTSHPMLLTQGACLLQRFKDKTKPFLKDHAQHQEALWASTPLAPFSVIQKWQGFVVSSIFKLYNCNLDASAIFFL